MTASACSASRSNAADRVAAARGWILDIDGCLVRTDRAGGEGGTLFPGTVELIDLLRSSGRRIVCCTNASLRPPRFYAEELRRAGLDLADDEVVTAGWAGADHIRRNHPGARVLALGDEGITEPLHEAGLALVESGSGEKADAVLVGAAELYHAAAIDSACRAVVRGAAFYVTVMTRWFHGGRGRSVSLSSAIAAAIAWVTDVPATVVGKPSAALAGALLDLVGLPATDVVVVGDSAEAEMQLAAEIGALGVLVLSGATSPEAVGALPKRHKPDLCAQDVGHLYELLKTRLPQGGSP